MSILVVCPGCKKSFQVHDKFAGKSGPCPTCKTVIKVPDKAHEVKIHTPEEFGGGGRGTTGKLALKPIARSETKVKPLWASIIGGGALVVLVLTFANRWLDFLDFFPIAGVGLVLILGLLAISYPLAFAAYTFLRDDELEGYKGKELCVRTAICAAIYVILWGIFAYVKSTMPQIELWQWGVLAPPFLAMGGGTAWLAFDIEPTEGFLHYSFYLLVTIVLGWVGGLGWIWSVTVAQ